MKVKGGVTNSAQHLGFYPTASLDDAPKGALLGNLRRFVRGEFKGIFRASVVIPAKTGIHRYATKFLD